MLVSVVTEMKTTSSVESLPVSILETETEIQ